MEVELEFGVVMFGILSGSIHSKFSLKLQFVVLIDSTQVYINVYKQTCA